MAEIKAQFLKGIGSSDGIAIAKTYLLDKPQINVDRTKTIDNIDEAIKSLEKTIATTTMQLEKIKDVATEKLGEEKGEIFIAHIGIANDPEMIKEMKALINDTKINVPYAIEQVYNKYYEVFRSMEDAYFKERATDILDIKERMLCNALGLTLPDLVSLDTEVVLICHELTPSDTAMLNKKFVKGIISETGGRTSHAAIMSRSLEIPAVLGVKDILTKVKPNQMVAIDGKEGIVDTNPDLASWQVRIQEHDKFVKELQKFVNVKTLTKDNVKVNVEANIGNPVDADWAIKYGCEGIGLYRSEFLYMGNNQWPTEEEQFIGYKSVLEKIKDEIVVIRTLDIGGDKKLSYYTFPEEMNPFLGYRAIRFCLANKDIFRTQLRALGRASVYGKLAIMFPMIATIDEFKQAKSFALEVFDELRKEGKPVADNIQIGMMVEIPASAAMADKFAKYADFFSIGTNDLIQYTMACDRMSKTVSYLYQPNNPALLRMIDMTIKGAHANNKWVGMCGEMAGDIMSTPLLLGLGLDNFSMSATSIPNARRIINNLNRKDCEKLVQEALNLETIDEVNALVKDFLTKQNLI